MLLPLLVDPTWLALLTHFVFWSSFFASDTAVRSQNDTYEVRSKLLVVYGSFGRDLGNSLDLL